VAGLTELLILFAVDDGSVICCFAVSIDVNTGTVF
jgi:hypothetical protein